MYNVMTKEGIKKIDKGYIKELLIDNYSFMVMLHRFPGNYYDSKKLWVVSDYNSGLRIGCDYTRQKALEDAKKNIIKFTPKIAKELSLKSKKINFLPGEDCQKVSSNIQSINKEEVKKKIKNKFFKDVRIDNLFIKIFNRSLTSFRDKLMLLNGDYTLDVIALDNYIHTPDGISMSNFILKEYGEKALKLVKKLMR